MPQESADTPKIAWPFTLPAASTEAAIRDVVQLGAYDVLSGGPTLPWTAGELQPRSISSRAQAL